MNARARQPGFSLLAILFVVAAMGIALSTAFEMRSTGLKREREAELIFVGREFREAIARYHHSGGQYPESLEALLQDPRSTTLKRHLRRIYPDPVTSRPDWGLVTLNERIVGVFSLSDRAPLKTDGFEPTEAAFKERDKYSDWWFTFPYDLKPENLRTRQFRYQEKQPATAGR
jgi:type II secretory pathway pseudopilin PulG